MSRTWHTDWRIFTALPYSLAVYRRVGRYIEVTGFRTFETGKEAEMEVFEREAPRVAPAGLRVEGCTPMQVERIYRPGGPFMGSVIKPYWDLKVTYTASVEGWNE